MTPIQTRSIVASMVLGAATLVGIASQEGYKQDAYIPIPGDVPTIGFGHTQGVKMGDKTTPVRSLIQLLNEVEGTYANGVKSCVTAPLYTYEFAAFVSLSYNIGVKAFCHSTVVRRVNAEDYVGACDAILMWDKANLKVIPGLTKRRKDEWELCRGESGNA